MTFSRVDRQVGPDPASFWAEVAAERCADYLARCARRVCAPSGVTAPERLAALEAMAARAVREDVVRVPAGTDEERMRRAAQAVGRARAAAKADPRQLAPGGALWADVTAAVVRAWVAQARGERGEAVA